mgnify:CR=1 FL=1
MFLDIIILLYNATKITKIMLLYIKVYAYTKMEVKMEKIVNLVKKAKKNDQESFCKLIEMVKKDLYLIAKTYRK